MVLPVFVHSLTVSIRKVITGSEFVKSPVLLLSQTRVRLPLLGRCALVVVRALFRASTRMTSRTSEQQRAADHDHSSWDVEPLCSSRADPKAGSMPVPRGADLLPRGRGCWPWIMVGLQSLRSMRLLRLSLFGRDRISRMQRAELALLGKS